MSSDVQHRPARLELPWIVRGPTGLRTAVAVVVLTLPMALSAVRVGGHPLIVALTAATGIAAGLAIGAATTRLRDWLLKPLPGERTNLHRVYWSHRIPPDDARRTRLHRQALRQDTPAYRSFRASAVLLASLLVVAGGVYCFVEGYVLLVGWCVTLIVAVLELAGPSRRNGTVIRRSLLERLTTGAVDDPPSVHTEVFSAEETPHRRRWLVLTCVVYVVVTVVLARALTPDAVWLPVVITLLSPVSWWLTYLDIKAGPKGTDRPVQWWA